MSNTTGPLSLGSNIPQKVVRQEVKKETKLALLDKLSKNPDLEFSEEDRRLFRELVLDDEEQKVSALVTKYPNSNLAKEFEELFQEAINNLQELGKDLGLNQPSA